MSSDKKLDVNTDFVKKYKAALAAGLSKEQLAGFMGVKPDTILNRRKVIADTMGFVLPYLKGSPKKSEADLMKVFSAELAELNKNENKDLHDASENEGDEWSKHDVYLITSAQNCTPVHEKFLLACETYCKINKARLLVIPYRYKNPTSIFQDSENEWWDNRIVPYLMEDRVKIFKHLQILGHIKKQPTAIQPLYGLDGETGLDSAVMGHPKIQLKAVATPSQALPKILTSSGAITVPNYTDSGAGWRGYDHHSFGAVVVELDRENEIFHLRHIHGDKETGSFYDLDRYYTPKTSSDSPRIPALITGDSHALFMDPDVEKATYTAHDSIVNILKPENLVLHDVMDGYSISHHHKNNDVVRQGKHRYGMNNVEKELQITADFIDRISLDHMMTYIVKSNHDEHFDKWLQECDYKNDLENAQFFHYMKYNQSKWLTPKEGSKPGFKTIDPFEFWCNHPDTQRGLQKKERVKVLKRDESLVLKSIELGFHGDKGTGGSRGSLKQFSKVGPKVVIGHSHTPGIYEGAYQVGVSSYMDLEYKTGCDSWLQTHCVVYPDGKRTLINVIRGKWRLKEVRW